MKTLILVTFSLIFFTSIAQQKTNKFENEISHNFYKNLDSLIAKYNIEDIREDKSQAIRIWKSNEIILLKEKEAIYTFHTSNSKKEIIKQKKFRSESDLKSEFELIEKILDSNQDNKYAIDAFPIIIELKNSKRYRIISFNRNANLEEILETIKIENSINKVKKEIIHTLPAGNYRIGMSSLKLDYIPRKNKSNFYRKLEPEIKSILKINNKTEPTKMPLVLINNKIKYFGDLNNLKISDVENYKIISDNSKILYGENGKYGVIKVTTN
ncbi:hypothetical protein [Zunongwangia endophytica]|uniref:Uncharacterized protein n=1 Tax=Zunongwangia endophytica TaxID=1808945 RepID=A0ABV8HG37_9FLAO|nr:hypothetical protein [Zunongwangia endophytica]MDN3593460.1 hypothetical protein [Zunongwangia endophytica]